MDILLIGSTGNLMRKLVEKLHKEGHRIFVLTQESKEVLGYRRVFETYRFSYENTCIREVFVSVKPAVTIFLGAYDKNFSWNTGMNTAVSYSSGLLNILMSFAALKQGRFIYLSSEEVYEDLYADNDYEVQRLKDSSEKAQSVAMGEKMCLDYGRMTMGDVVVLRLGNLYGIPEDVREIDNVCAKMCMDALDLNEIKMVPGRSIEIDRADAVMDMKEEDAKILEGKEYTLLNLMDAIEYIYKLATVETHKSPIYQVSGQERISQRQLAELIAEGMKQEEKGKEPQRVAIVDSMGDSCTNVLLSRDDFDEEFRMNEMNTPQKAVPLLAAYMKKNAGKFSRRSDRQENALERFIRLTKEVIRAAVPFIENLICFIPFFMLNNRATGSEYFGHLDFYLLYVLLFAIVHGQQQAIFSSLLAIAGYCFRQMYNRSGFDVMLDYSTYVWMAQLLILGLVVGYMKDRLKSIKEEDANEVEFLTRQLADMSDINGSNVRVKDVLSDQLINQNDSIGKIYEITSGLEQYGPEEVLFYAAEILSRIMHCKDVAVYSVANEQYARLFSATSEKARCLGNSVQYRKMERMYSTLQEHKVYINKTMDENYPLMANAIYAESEMRIIVMVWGIPWERMTLGQANVLAITSYLIQNAVLRANRYMEIIQSQRYIGDTKILEDDDFDLLIAAFLSARKKGLTVCTIVKVERDGRSLEEMNSLLLQVLRTTDYIGLSAEGELKLLLGNTNSEDALLAVKRLQAAGVNCQIEEEPEE